MTAVRGWAIYAPNGEFIFSGCTEAMTTQLASIAISPLLNLDELKAAGYRCIPVTIQEARHDER